MVRFPFRLSYRSSKGQGMLNRVQHDEGAGIDWTRGDIAVFVEKLGLTSPKVDESVGAAADVSEGDQHAFLPRAAQVRTCAMLVARSSGHFARPKCHSVPDKVTYRVAQRDAARGEGDVLRGEVTHKARKVTLFAPKVTDLRVLLQDRAPSAPSCGDAGRFAHRMGRGLPPHAPCAMRAGERGHRHGLRGHACSPRS